eukprot:TRINITY_DN10359_c0_g1_i1.p1 TRINITY_DN10359_c0_g1~~TRINITY_DN10359_c0_g1_i1.p1  ORF type:complete len:1207 (+),score=276.23 TRINITY_DN10359_c0_g1_i1:189-3809(+)
MGQNRGGSGRGGAMASALNVSESNRISIAERLENFRSSPDQVLTFEPTLSNHDRALVHRMCLKLGLKSKSSGKGDQRRVSVFKRTTSNKGQSEATPLTFCFETQEVLHELFSMYPPSEQEFLTNLDESAATVQPFDKSADIIDACFCKPQLNQAQIEKQREALASRMKKSPVMQEIVEKRSKLPIAASKDIITSAIDSHRVVLIAGETGCGKSTQVPQFILDHMWSQHKSCKILCTQPRRISAISVAERVAAERGENVGGNVGYQIRMETKGGRHSSIMFCTNGVLLRKLVATGNQVSRSDVEHQRRRKNKTSGIFATHIIVDEVHERDCNADFMLIILRDLLQLWPDLRLILMSATIDAELFSKYFNNCPIIRVPGFTYPVRTYYLEDVLGFLKNGKSKRLVDESGSNGTEFNNSFSEEDIATMDEAIDSALLEDDFDVLMNIISENPQPNICNYQHSKSGVTALMVAAGKGRVDEVSLMLNLGADCQLEAHDGTTALDWAMKEQQDEIAGLISRSMKDKVPVQSLADKELLKDYMATADVDDVNVNLIRDLLEKVYAGADLPGSGSEQGAVLVFLPGWEEISRCKECLQKSPLLGDSSKFIILPLHSMVPSNEQKKVFKRPPASVKKIVLATNIAETSVTIDDITIVLDSGFMKEKSYDPYSNVSTLQVCWISKASARQREGRAGRCQPGVCYHLYSKERAAALPDYQIPEIKRTSLEELCLQVKLLNPHSDINDFLSKAVDPPADLAVRNAIILLQEIGALNHEEKLTELGKQLGSLPLHPSTSKMLLFAILMNCLDPALTLACASGYREPFVIPMAPKDKKSAFAAKMELASRYGGYSDHLAVIAAFECWREAKIRGSQTAFCSKYFVSNSVMVMLEGMRKQLWSELSQKGLVPEDLHSCSLNAHDPGILRAVLLAGLYPMVGILLPPLPTGQKAVILTCRGEKVRIHPHSTNIKLVHYSSKLKKLGSRPLLVFDEITRSEAFTSIKNCSLVKPYSLLLLAKEMVVAALEEEGMDYEDEDDDTDDDVMPGTIPSKMKQSKVMSSPDNVISVVIDRWLRFQATSLDAAQFYCLRERLSAAIAFKVRHPRQVLPPELGHSIFAIACLLSFDGNIDMEAPSESPQRAATNTFESRQISRDLSRNDHGTPLVGTRKGNHVAGGVNSVVPPGKSFRGTSNGHYQNGSMQQSPKQQQYVPVRDGRTAM